MGMPKSGDLTLCKLIIKLIEFLVISSSEPTFRCDIHDQQHVAFILFQRYIFPLDRLSFEIVDGLGRLVIQVSTHNYLNYKNI
ncbi:GSCOCG00009405001-RA-CDS [Cotesia congregata]|nr:GSCOCG00009405001-RA-CDS [Cotesia congregata]